jgi:hypothetical protein
MKEAVEEMPVEEFPELPENLYDRQPTIKAQPVQPNSVIYGDTTPDNARAQQESTDGYTYSNY